MRRCDTRPTLGPSSGTSGCKGSSAVGLVGAATNMTHPSGAESHNLLVYTQTCTRTNTCTPRVLTVCLVLHQHVRDCSHKLLYAAEPKAQHRKVFMSIALQGEGRGKH